MKSVRSAACVDQSDVVCITSQTSGRVRVIVSALKMQHLLSAYMDPRRLPSPVKVGGCYQKLSEPSVLVSELRSFA